MEDTFANRLKTALSIRGINAAKLSRLTKTPESVISQYKKGEYVPKQRRLENFATVLNVSIPWLMGGDVPMEDLSANDSDSTYLTPHEKVVIHTYRDKKDMQEAVDTLLGLQGTAKIESSAD